MKKNLNEMSDSQLKEIAKKKNNKRVATPQALNAQRILYDRTHTPETSYHRTFMYDFCGEKE